MPTPTQIIESIRREPKVPAPSQTVFRVLELTKDPDCDIGKVAEVIGRDSGLTAQLLRQANSAMYGFRTPTSSVSGACTRLGLKQVRSAVLNQHVVGGLGEALPTCFDASRYWQATFATSVAAQDLCGRLLPARAEDAGTAGLLCDIGVGLMAFGVPQLYERVLSHGAQPPSRAFDEIELQLLGVSHAEVGAAVLADWKLEEHIIQAVRHHHAASTTVDGSGPDEFVQIIAAATSLAGIALDGSDMESVAALFTQVEALTSDVDAVITDVLDKLVGHIENTAESMVVVLGPVDQMQANFDDLVRGLPDVSQWMSCHPMPHEPVGS